MSGHTPGPWYPGHFVDDDHSCNCTGIVSEHGPMGGIASVHIDNGKAIGDGGNDAPPLEEAKANARLIAAAPEMLEALMQVRRFVEAHDHDETAPFALGIIDAAIAKATAAPLLAGDEG